MEELVLTDPVVEPEKVTTKYKVTTVTLSTTAGHDLNPEPGYVGIDLLDNLGQPYFHAYTGAVALDMVKWLNTANLSTKSMHKRILERLAADGVLPGTVTGAPDPPVQQEEE